MEKQVDQRYLYTADAVALGGQITAPFCDVIESQAATVLPISGGHGVARAKRFNFRDLVSFDAAFSMVTGNEVEEHGGSVFHTLTTTTIEGLNIASTVTADAVVARLVSRYDRRTGRREVLPVGSAFVNLRIAGKRVEPRPRNTLYDNGSLPELEKACEREGRLATLGRDLAALRSTATHQDEQARDTPQREKRLLTCLFDVYDDDDDCDKDEKVPSGCARRGDCGIRVPGFGTVYLGEYYVTRYSRRLSMLRVELGCPVRGTVTTNVVGGNGSDYP
jgi:hypothetical protein